MMSKLKSLGLKLAVAVPAIVTGATLLASKASAAAVTYTPLLSATDTKDTFDGVVSTYGPIAAAILVTLGVATVAFAWLRFGFRGAAAGGLPGRRKR